MVVASAYMISHTHLFGLLQLWQRLRGRPLTDPEFQTRGCYRFVRHPLMLGFLLAFWATPDMTVAHLLFAGGTTGYILVALRLEEWDLLSAIGDAYRRYREEVPMLIPLPRRTAGNSRPRETKTLLIRCALRTLRPRLAQVSGYRRTLGGRALQNAGDLITFYPPPCPRWVKQIDPE